MNFGVETKKISKYFNNFIFHFCLPQFKIGFFNDLYNNDEKWIGFKIGLETDVYFERYDYGWVFSFVILGIGIIINKINL